MLRALRRKFGQAGIVRGGSLYTWGHATDALGRKSSGQVGKLRGEWDGKVRDCALGNRHGAFVTSESG